MSNFQEFVQDIQKQSILNEVEAKRKVKKDNFYSWFNNFRTFLPGGFMYQQISEQDYRNKQFHESGKTNEKFINDINDAILETGINLEAAMKIDKQAHDKYREAVKLLHTDIENSKIDNIQNEHLALSNQFVEALIPPLCGSQDEGLFA